MMNYIILSECTCVCYTVLLGCSNPDEYKLTVIYNLQAKIINATDYFNQVNSQR